MEGQCFNFSQILKAFIDDTNFQILENESEGHVYIKWDGVWWDIRGMHSHLKFPHFCHILRLDGQDPPCGWGARDIR